MNKTLLTTALAFVLTLGGFAAFAEGEAETTDQTTNSNVAFKKDGDGVRISNGAKPLKIIAGSSNITDNDLLDKLANAATNSDNKQFGYLLNGTEFVSLQNAISQAKIFEGNTPNVKFASISLGKFTPDALIQFGYGTGPSDFTNTVSLNVSGDPGYYTGYNSENFFQLDFSEDPFNGMIEVFVMGEPLPASTVSLLVALGAGAAFLLYHNRKRRIGAVEQA